MLRQDASSNSEQKVSTSIEFSGMMIVKSRFLMLVLEIWFWDVSMVSMQLFWLMVRQVLEKHIQWEQATQSEYPLSRLVSSQEYSSSFLMSSITGRPSLNTQSSKLKFLSWSFIMKSSMTCLIQRACRETELRVNLKRRSLLERRKMELLVLEGSKRKRLRRWNNALAFLTLVSIIVRQVLP